MNDHGKNMRAEINKTENKEMVEKMKNKIYQYM